MAARVCNNAWQSYAFEISTRLAFSAPKAHSAR